ncbi:ESX-1 secretion-associated protein [Mycolicibacterium sp. BiH015]|uniref:ESX-1 secretion-associated protein n=1 Tax=Mycolicibacterium sp. BiH015 TaxID=3018808 RepID=UPI0022DF36C1|nr:ESX-1 secretion-associated protein [Mycolicibacterium sp. BiH015]
MYARLSADAGLIDDYAAACAAHAAELKQAAATLCSAGAGSGAMFGPVGARFLASLARAARDDADGITQLSRVLAAGSDAATGTVHAYTVADDAAAARIARG